jgi:hypothetical protein
MAMLSTNFCSLSLENPSNSWMNVLIMLTSQVNSSS